jgi:hypothetical protein
MSSETRTAAQQNSDLQGGHRSLAGYVFQLFGSMTEAIELVRTNPMATAINGLITLEAFGQDSFVFLDASTGRSRFTQYKHSLIGQEIQPAELREILEGFVKSVEIAGRTIENCEFVLATNRDPSPWAGQLLTTREQYNRAPSKENSEALDVQLWRGCNVKRPTCASDMLEILKILNWTKIDEKIMGERAKSQAFDLGVPKRDVEQQIGDTLGLFLNKANSPSYRTVQRRELIDKLAGHPNARSLRCTDSRREQKSHISGFLNTIHSGQKSIRRDIVREIVSASLAFPLVLIVGDGGRGKSAAAWQSLLEQLKDENEPPDFCTGHHYSSFTETKLINEFAGWRNQVPNKDGTSIEIALERLEAGSPHSKLLLLYIDGIDEKNGKVNPFQENQRFIEELFKKFVNESTDYKQNRISFLVSCRTVEEAKWLTIHTEKASFKTIFVDSFSDLELEELAMSLGEEPKNLLLSIVSKTQGTQQRFAANADDDLVLPLKEPRVWASFADLDIKTQVGYLSRSAPAQRTLAEAYVRRIEQKASQRLGFDLPQHLIPTILKNAGAIALQNNSGVLTRAQWIQVCRSEDLNATLAHQLFNEFATSGLFNVESDGGKRWSWKQIWLRDAICDEEVFSE